VALQESYYSASINTLQVTHIPASQPHMQQEHPPTMRRATTTLLVLLSASLSSLASAAYGPLMTGRTTFYGGAPDGMNPDSPSYGTSEGSCGCAFLPSLFSIAIHASEAMPMRTCVDALPSSCNSPHDVRTVKWFIQIRRGCL